MTATDVRPPTGTEPPRRPGRARRALRRAGDQLTRVVMLLLLLVVSGITIGLVLGYPVSLIEFEDTGAVRLDQANLVGTADTSSALVGLADLPPGWEPGDPAFAVFGVLGSEFCGDKPELTVPLEDQDAAVFSNPSTGGGVISQAIRVDKWQSARDYVQQVDEALAQCDEFFQATPAGRLKVQVESGGGSPPVTDYASGTYVSRDPRSVQEFSLMAVGDLVVAVTSTGPNRTSRSFLNQVEARILARLAPADFAPGGVEGGTTVPGAPTTAAPAGGAPAGPTTTLGSGSADESGGP